MLAAIRAPLHRSLTAESVREVHSRTIGFIEVLCGSTLGGGPREVEGAGEDGPARQAPGDLKRVWPVVS